MSNLIKATKILLTNLAIKLLGVSYCSFVLILLLISFPVYVFRVVIIFVAKTCRSDFGDILSGQSTLFTEDCFAETNPRSNLVLSMIIEGQLTLEEVRALVLKNWILSSDFKKFRQHPVKWMGFTFWKKIPKSFHVKDYVHEYTSKHIRVTDQELDEFVERLLNSRLPSRQSPWELHLIQNYRPSKDKSELIEAKPRSVLILKWHHCLVDGTGVVAALVEGLFQQLWIRKLENPRPKKPTWQKLLLPLTFPVMAFMELSGYLSRRFVDNPFKIPDGRKEWQHVCARSGLIPNQVIKDIKNTFGVSYTSVLISAISAAVHKTGMQTDESVYFMSALPAIGVSKRQVLSNHMTGMGIDIPTTSYKSPVERLKRVDKIFEDKRSSVQPGLVQNLVGLVGAHLSSFTEILFKNKMVPLGLTNIAGPHSDIKINENANWIHSRLVGGCLSGDGGLAIAAMSHGLNTELYIAAEKALMTRKQAEMFLRHIMQEVDTLAALVMEKR